MNGELTERAAVPVAPPLTAVPDPFVNNVKTMAGGTEVGAGATAYAPERNPGPEFVLEVVIEPPLDLLGVEAGLDARWVG
jgi:hypothetical protein